jgi:hypothetical protein
MILPSTTVKTVTESLMDQQSMISVATVYHQVVPLIIHVSIALELHMEKIFQEQAVTTTISLPKMMFGIIIVNVNENR